MHSARQKNRITDKKCPNPLFEDWLMSWRDQAVSKESRMQYTFSIALKSLRLYPIPLESGKECKILKGFGDKLCKMLDDKLKEYKKNNGVVKTQQIRTDLLNNKDTNIVPISSSKKNEDSAKSNQKGKKRNSYAGEPTVGTKAKAESSSKQYIPQYGSGGYAILMTLYTESLKPDYPGYLHKSDIIAYGKHLVNSSFTKPDPGSRYTAWSSMRTLLSKELISKVSNPPKFSLTEQGLALAKKLYEKSELASSSENSLERLNCTNIDTNTCDDNEVKSNGIPGASAIMDPYEDIFSNGYLRSNNDIVSTTEERLHCQSENLKDDIVVIGDESPKDQHVDYLDEIFFENIDVPTTSTEAFDSNVFADHLDIPPQTSKKKITRFESCPIQPQLLNNDLIVPKPKKLLQKYASVDIISSGKTNDLQPMHKKTLKKFTSSSSLSSVKSCSDVIDIFSMPPYSFDIILYVDTSETSGLSNSHNDELLQSLTRCGVKFEVKKLKVSDFAWICRARALNNELVLPYVVERKRMDDFASSIKDKRYYEQKFRLKKSGIENLIYLVESHGKNEHVGLPLQNLYQAASNTAIQEDFFVKFTENTRETVDYLANMSKTLINLFVSKTLSSCSKEDYRPVDINSDSINLITFKEFQETSIKNKRMYVTDLFVKMLIQLKGLSVDRALAITKKYPTPLLLKMEYEHISASEGEKLLANIKYGALNKSLGATISKTIYQAFQKMQY